jgi:integrase
MKAHKRQRGKDSWELIAYDRSARKNVYQTFRGNEKDAETAQARLVAKVADGRKRAPRKNLTFDDLAWEWLEDRRESPNVGTPAFKQYEWIVRTKLGPTLGSRAPHRIQRQDVLALRRNLVAQGFSARTVRHVLGVLAMVYKYARLNGFVHDDPTHGVERPSPGPTPIAPDVEDVQEFLATGVRFGQTWATLSRLMAATGMRRGEIGALRWRDIDLAKRQVSVVSSLTGDTRGTPTKTPNTKAGARTIAIDSATVESLKRLREWCAERADQCEVPAPGRDSFVFSPEPDGSLPFHPVTITHRFQAIRAKCNSTVRPHGLRRFNATQQAASGVPLREMMGRNGWDDIRTAMGYTTYVGAKDQGLADLMGGVLDGNND